jgi:hypothetical protein
MYAIVCLDTGKIEWENTRYPTIPPPSSIARTMAQNNPGKTYAICFIVKKFKSVPSVEEIEY